MNDFNSMRYKNDVMFRFFTNEIYTLNRDIQLNKEAIKKLTKKQEELKRGKTKLVMLRRELDFRPKA